jgi:hypothetical protein
MPESSTKPDNTSIKRREAAIVELTPLRLSRTSSEAAIGATTSVGSPTISNTQAVENEHVVSEEEFPTGTRLYAIFLALALAVLIVGLVGIVRGAVCFAALMINATGRIYCSNYDSSNHRQLQILRGRGLVWFGIVSFAESQGSITE